jgi:hypothetical protein
MLYRIHEYHRIFTLQSLLIHVASYHYHDNIAFISKAFCTIDVYMFEKKSNPSTTSRVSTAKPLRDLQEKALGLK